MRALLTALLLLLPVAAQAQILQSGSSSYVNQIIISSAPTGHAPTISLGGQGSDNNIGLSVLTKGTGLLTLPATTLPTITVTGAATVNGNALFNGGFGAQNGTFAGTLSVGGLANLGTAQTGALSVGDLDGALGYGAARFGTGSDNAVFITPGATTSTAATLTLGGTAGLALPVVMLPSWTTSGRPATTTGTLGVNTTTGFPEVALGGTFHQVITDQGGQTIPSLTLSGSGTALTIGGVPAVVTGDGTVINGAQSYAYPATGNDNRPNFFSSTLTEATGQTSAGVQENLFSQVVLNGAGTITGEINIIHSYFENDGVADTSGQGIENFEASGLGSSGSVGVFTNYLGIYTNGGSATVGTLIGLNLGLTNNNTTPGSVGTYVRLSAGPVSGTQPTNDYLIQATDPAAVLATLGPVNIGQNGAPAAGTLLQVVGPDSSGSTLSFAVKSGVGNAFYVTDAGNAVAGSTITATGYNVPGVPGVSCAAGTVSVTTLAVNSGIVTHC